MSHSGNKHDNQSLDRLVGFLLAAAGAYVALRLYQHSDAFFRVAEQFFMLPKPDVQMIPVAAVLFFLFWRGMKRFFFAPLLQLIEEREAATVGAQKSAKDLQRRADMLEHDFERRLAAARIEIMKEQLSELSKVKEHNDQLIRHAQAVADREMQEARAAIAQDMHALANQLWHETDELAAALVKNLQQPPGRSVQHEV